MTIILRKTPINSTQPSRTSHSKACNANVKLKNYTVVESRTSNKDSVAAGPNLQKFLMYSRCKDMVNGVRTQKGNTKFTHERIALEVRKLHNPPQHFLFLIKIKIRTSL